MPETIAECIARWTTSTGYEDLPQSVTKKAKGLMIDTLGCAIGGYSSGPATLARRLAAQVSQQDLPGVILGSGQKTTLEMATFANGVMLRYLDFNDYFVSKGGGHPSDNLAPVLTCAEAVHAGGRETILALTMAYEVYCRLEDQYQVLSKGFDQAVSGVVSCTVGAAKVLGLSREQIVQAINLAVAPNIALAQTRVGELSMWKACAMANAARNAVFAALLAREGMTGPDAIFEGRYGLFNAVTGPFQLEEFGGGGRPFRIMDASIKRHPCNLIAQTAVDAAIKLRREIASIEEIAEVKIGTFATGKSVLAGDVEKWHPRTRESADHSFPYLVSIALMHGSMELKHFGDEHLHDPALLDLMQKTKVEVDEECERLHPGTQAARLEITTRSGKRLSELAQYHRGHYRNPFSDQEIEQKFHSLTEGLLPPEHRKDVLSLIWYLDKVQDIGKVVQLLRV